MVNIREAGARDRAAVATMLGRAFADLNIVGVEGLPLRGLGLNTDLLGTNFLDMLLRLEASLLHLKLRLHLNLRQS